MKKGKKQKWTMALWDEFDAMWERTNSILDENRDYLHPVQLDALEKARDAISDIRLEMLMYDLPAKPPSPVKRKVV